RSGQSNGAGLRSVVGRIALGGMKCRGRTDDDQRAFGGAQHTMEFSGAGHQAHQVDFQHFAESTHFEFATAINYRALRKHQHIEPIERGLKLLDRAAIADVELRVLQTLELRSFVHRIVSGGSPGTADMYARAPCAERLADAVADAA